MAKRGSSGSAYQPFSTAFCDLICPFLEFEGLIFQTICSDDLTFTGYGGVVSILFDRLAVQAFQPSLYHTERIKLQQGIGLELLTGTCYKPGFIPGYQCL